MAHLFSRHQLFSPLLRLGIAVLLALMPLFTSVLSPPAAQAQGGCTLTTLDWDPAHVTPNGATTVANGNTYSAVNTLQQTFGPASPAGRRHVSLDFLFTGNTARFATPSPSDTTGQDPSGAQSLVLNPDFAATGEAITLTVTFSSDVTNLQFNLYDVDSRALTTNQDGVQITGRDNSSVAQAATISTNTNNQVTGSTGNTYTLQGTAELPTILPTTNSTVGVNFGANTVRTLTLRYFNPNTGNTAAQTIGVGDLSFCAPVTPTCSTSVGVLDWGSGTNGNADWNPTGPAGTRTFSILGNATGAPVNFTFAISGATTQYTNSTPDDIATITGGIPAPNNQSWLHIVDPPAGQANNSVITTTITLDSPVQDLYFQMFDVDVSNNDATNDANNVADDDRRDIVQIKAFNTVLSQNVAVFMLGTSSAAIQDNIIRGDTVSGINGGSDAGTQGAPSTSDEANVDVRFPAPVNQIQIVYSEGGGASNPTGRGMAIGNIQFCRPPALAVEINSFGAECVADGTGTRLVWETASESNLLGFNLWRNTTPDTQGTRLNEELIAAQSPGGGGASYVWVDSTSVAGVTYFYTLESVDLDGATTVHDTISSTCVAPTAIQLGSFEGTTSSLPIALAVGVIIGVVGIGIGVRRLRR